MADHFIAINKGKDGSQPNHFTFGVGSSPSTHFELRIADLDAQGKAPTRLDVNMALKPFANAILSNYQTFPPL
jgi:hypothetical protein